MREEWLDQRFRGVENDMALDGLMQESFDAAAKGSPVVAANGKNIGDTWRTVDIVNQMQRQVKEGKVGLPGGETFDSVPEALGSYAKNIGQYIADSIITPAKGDEKSDKAALDYLTGSKSITDTASGMVPPPKEPGPLDAVYPFLKPALLSITETMSLMPIVGGIRDATQEAMNLGDAIADKLGEITGTNITPTGRRVSKEETSFGTLPEVLEPDTMPAQIERSIAQFLTGFVVGGKALKTLGWAAEAGGIGIKAARLLLQGFAADFGFFKGQDAKLADLIQEVPALQNPVTEFLSSHPDDTDAEGRLKRGLEGIIVVPLIPFMLGVLKTLRRYRAANAAETGIVPPEARASEISLVGDASPEAPLSTKLGDAMAETGQTGVPEDVVVKSLTERGLTPLGNGEVYVNFARINAGEDIQKIIQDTSTAFKESVDASRRGVRTHAETNASAEDIDAFNLLMSRRQGQAYNAEELTAARNLWIAAGTKMEEVIDAAHKAPTPENMFAFRKMFATFHAIQKEVLGATAEAGRALNALKIPAGLGSRERMIQIERIVNDFGGIDANLNMMEMVRALSKDKKALSRFAEKSTGLKTVNSMQQWFYFSILSSPKTQMRNIVSSAGMIPLRMIETATAARLGRATGTPDAIQIGEAAAQWQGIKTSWRRALQATSKTWRTGEAPFAGANIEKFGYRPRENAISAEAWGLRQGGAVGRAVDAIGAVTSLPGKGLQSADAFFKTVHHDMTAWQEAFKIAQKEISKGMPSDLAAARMSEIIADMPENLRIKAEADALHWTFNDPPGKVVQKILALRNVGAAPDASPAQRMAGYWARTVLPFVNTPANIWQAGIERTPLAPAVARYREAIAKGGGEADLARTKMALGTMFVATSIDLASEGMITGAGPDPRAEPEKFALWQRQGKQPYSIKIGDTYYSYRGMEPFSTLFGWGASLGEWMQKSDFTDPDEQFDYNSAVAHTIFSAMDSGLSASFMQGMSDTISAIDDPEGSAANYLKRYMSTYVAPAIVRDVGQSVDPVRRYTTNFIEEAKTRWGMGQGLPPMRDFWGRQMTGASGVGFVYDMVVPFRARAANAQPIDLAMEEDGWAPQNPAKKLSVLGQEISLKGDRFPIYSRYMELRGAIKPSQMGPHGAGLASQFGDLTLLETMNAIVSGQHAYSGQYSQLPPEGREKLLREIIGAYSRVARAQVIAEYPELEQIARDRIVRAAKRGELEPEQEAEEPNLFGGGLQLVQ